MMNASMAIQSTWVINYKLEELIVAKVSVRHFRRMCVCVCMCVWKPLFCAFTANSKILL